LLNIYNTEFTMVIPTQNNSEDELRIADRNMKAFRRAYEAGHTKWQEIATTCEEYYAGKQWSDEDVKKLSALKRPALTLNIIRPTVNAILGEYANKRATFNVKPLNEGDQQIADVLTKLMMQVADDNSFEYVESEVFQDGMITDRGFYDIRMDFDENVQGDIRITSVDPFTVIVDPQAKEQDPKTWREVFVTKWMSIDDISELYGDSVAERVRTQALSSNLGAEYAEYTRRGTFGTPEFGYAYDQIPSDERDIKRIRVIDRQHYVINRAEVFIDPVTGEENPVPDTWDEQKVSDYSALTGAMIITKAERKVRWTITAGNVVLHDDFSPYPFFTIVPYFPQFRRGKPLGWVRDMLDSQQQINKLSSQALHVVNSTANSGWVIEEGALVNMTPEELARDGAKTGVVLVTAHGKQAHKIEPNPLPSGLMQFVNYAQDMVRKISGVSDYMVGEGHSEVSGIALDARVNRNLTQLQPVFDSLDRSRTVLAKHMLTLMQMYYTDTRVMRITSENEAGEQTQEIVAINQPTQDGRVINDLTIGKYDVVVTSQPNRETFVETQFAQAIQMVQAGIPIPPDIMVELSNFARKNEVAERIRQQMGMGQPSPEQQQQMQMQQQVQMQQVMLEMQKLQAQITELNSQAELNKAKAYAAVTNPAIEYKSTVTKQQAALQNKANEMDTKAAIARMQVMSRAAEGGRVRQAESGRYNQIQSLTAGAEGI
jgi:hypothetical protein